MLLGMFPVPPVLGVVTEGTRIWEQRSWEEESKQGDRPRALCSSAGGLEQLIWHP